MHLEKDGREFAESGYAEIDLLLLKECDPESIKIQKDLLTLNDFSEPIKVSHTIGQMVQFVPLPKQLIMTNLILQELGINAQTTDLMEF